MISYYMDLMGNIRIEFDCKIQSIVFCPKLLFDGCGQNLGT